MPSEPLCVRLPVPTYDEVFRVARDARITVPELVRQAIARELQARGVIENR